MIVPVLLMPAIPSSPPASNTLIVLTPADTQPLISCCLSTPSYILLLLLLPLSLKHYFVMLSPGDVLLLPLGSTPDNVVRVLAKMNRKRCLPSVASVGVGHMLVYAGSFRKRGEIDGDLSLLQYSILKPEGDT